MEQISVKLSLPINIRRTAGGFGPEIQAAAKSIWFDKCREFPLPRPLPAPGTGRPARHARVSRHRLPLRPRPGRTAMTTFNPRRARRRAARRRLRHPSPRSRRRPAHRLRQLAAPRRLHRQVHHGRHQHQRRRHPARQRGLGSRRHRPHAGEFPASSGERRMLLLAASIAGGIPVSLCDTCPASTTATRASLSALLPMPPDFQIHTRKRT